MELSKGIVGHTPLPATWDPKARRYVLRAPAGTVHVYPKAPGWRRDEGKVTLRAGQTRTITLDLHATSIIDVVFRGRVARIPFSRK